MCKIQKRDISNRGGRLSIRRPRLLQVQNSESLPKARPRKFLESPVNGTKKILHSVVSIRENINIHQHNQNRMNFWSHQAKWDKQPHDQMSAYHAKVSEQRTRGIEEP